MNNLILKAPLNPLSFGNVSFNLLKEIYKKGINLSFFPIGKIDTSSFEMNDEGFNEFLKESINDRFKKLDKNHTTLQMWHLNGAENRISKKQILFTFYELDKPTNEELSLAKLQDKLVFSSEYASNKFENSSHAPLGFDESLFSTGKKYLSDKIHFGLMGKFEKRKHTAKIIRCWAKKYGNNFKYQLTCCVTNPFFKKEQMEEVLRDTLQGNSYGNINFLPFLPKNSQVNDYLNSIDIDLGGMSGAEGWNLPSFNASCLGKWSVVLNATSHKDWAKKDNCVMVDPDGKEPVYDNIFFHEGSQFNQGDIYTFDEDEFVSAMVKAESLRSKKNEGGLALKNEFTYKNTLEKILE